MHIIEDLVQANAKGSVTIKQVPFPNQPKLYLVQLKLCQKLAAMDEAETQLWNDFIDSIKQKIELRNQFVRKNAALIKGQLLHNPHALKTIDEIFIEERFQQFMSLATSNDKFIEEMKKDGFTAMEKIVQMAQRDQK